MIVFMLSEKPLLSRIQQIPGFLRGSPRLVAGSNLSDLKVGPPKRKPTQEPAYKNEWSLVAVEP
jgi:hypothetical protein